MITVADLVQALGLVQADLVLLNLKVDSALQSMKEESILVDRMVTTLKGIITTGYKTGDGGMTSTKSL